MRFLLSPSGRLSRRDWLVWAVPIFGGAFLLAGAVDALLLGGNVLFGPVRLWLGLALLWPSIALTSRRLHDLDRSAWDLLPIVVLLAGGPLLWVTGAALTQEGFTVFTLAALGMVLLGLMLAAVLLGQLCVASGEARANRYGPAPSGASASRRSP
jgi:uncharacterized membrane protein YhaH (DUF805 family)